MQSYVAGLGLSTAWQGLHVGCGRLQLVPGLEEGSQGHIVSWAPNPTRLRAQGQAHRLCVGTCWSMSYNIRGESPTRDGPGFPTMSHHNFIVG